MKVTFLEPASPTEHKTRCIALMRRVLGEMGVPQICPLRKCRRDGTCTGPLVIKDPAGLCRLAGEEEVLASDRVLTPACIIWIGESWEAVEGPFFRRSRIYFRRGIREVLLPLRAIGARKWGRVELWSEAEGGQDGVAPDSATAGGHEGDPA